MPTILPSLQTPAAVRVPSHHFNQMDSNSSVLMTHRGLNNLLELPTELRRELYEMVTSLLSSATPGKLHGDRWRSSGRFGALFQCKQGLPPSPATSRMFSDWEAPLKGGPPFLWSAYIGMID